MDTEAYEQIKSVIDKATQGKWWADSHGHNITAFGEKGIDRVLSSSMWDGEAKRHPETGNLSHWPNDWDLTYIVTANPKNVKMLLDEIERLNVEVDRLTKQLMETRK